MVDQTIIDLVRKYYYWAVKTRVKDAKVGQSYFVSDGRSSTGMQVATVTSIDSKGVIKTDKDISFSTARGGLSTRKVDDCWLSLYDISECYKRALKRQQFDQEQDNVYQLRKLEAAIQKLNPQNDVEFIGKILEMVNVYLEN